jgi:hypothetical protein
MSDHTGVRAEKSAFSWRRGVEILGVIAAWFWFILAGCGGLWLMITTGPWPPTHGWFVLCSGLSVWPVTARLCKKYLRVTLSGRARLGAAALFVLAGRLAVTFLWPRPGQPVNQPDWVAILSGIILLTTVLNRVLAHSRKPPSSR